MKKSILLIFAYSAIILSSVVVNAQTTRYWKGAGSSDNIDDDGNWWNIHPNAGDNLYFDNTTGSHHWAYSNYGAGSWFGEIKTFNGAGGIKFYGNNTYVYKFENFSDGNLFEINNSTVGNRIGYDLEINPVGSGGISLTGSSLTIDCNNAASRILKIYGSYSLSVSNVISQINTTGGFSASLVVYNAPTLTLSGANTFSGGTTLSAGVLKIGVNSNGSVGSITSSAIGTGSLTLNGGTISSNNTTARSILNPFTLGGDITLGDGTNTGTLTLSASGSLTGTRQLTIASAVIFEGVLSGTQTTYGITKAGAGALTLSGGNTYTGLTTISAGTLKLNKSGGTTIPVTNDITASGGTLQISSNQTINNLTLSGSGNLTVDNGVTLSINGTFDYSGSSTISLGSGASIAYGAGATLKYSGNVARTTSNSEWPTTSAPSNVIINTTSPGTVTLHAARSISGNFTINSGATFDVSTSNFALNVAGAWTNSGGTFIPRSGTVTFNGATAQSIGTETFYDVVFSGIGGKTAGGNLTVTHNFSNSGSLDMTGYTLAISGTTTNTGTVRFSGLANGIAIGTGIVEYYGTTQTVASGNYSTLNIMNPGIKTAGGNINATALDNGGPINNAAILDMVGFTLTATVDNAGATIRFNGASNGIAVSTGTVEYYGATQNVATGTYSILNITAAGTKTAGGSIIVSNALDNGGSSNVASVLDMAGNTLTLNGTFDNAGATIRFNGAGNGKAISSGTVEYYGITQTIASGVYSTLNITAAGTKTAGGIITITSALDNGGPSNVAAVFDMAGYTLNASTIDNTGATVKFSGATNGKAITTGTVEYYGASTQTVTAGTYATLNITTSGTKSIAGAITATNVNVYSPAVLEIAGSGNLTVTNLSTYAAGGLLIKSTPTGTGSLLNSTFNVNATVERYIANDWKWHFLSSPVAAQAVWPEFAPSTPFGASGWNWDFYYFNPKCPANGLSWVNLRKTNGDYNNGTVDDASSNAGFGNTSPPDFTVARGYMVAYTSGWTTGSPTTHLFTGALNTGSISKPVVSSASQYNLVGNPYPSAIDWKAPSGWTRSSLVLNGSGYDYWIWNDNAGNYGIFNSANTTGTNGTSRYIAPLQAFFVKANADGNLGMDNGIRVHDNTQAWLKNAEAETTSLRLKLTSSVNSYSDEMVVDFDPSFTGGGSDKFWSFYSEAPEIYSVKDGINYSINRYNGITENLLVPVATKTGVKATYTITATNISDFTLTNKVILEDLKTGTMQQLNDNPVYSFAAKAGDDANRFVLHFADVTTSVTKPAAKETFSLYQNNGNLNIISQSNVNAEIMVTNMLGQVVLRGKTNGNTLTTLNAGLLKNGVYVVSLVGNGRIVSKKIVVSK
jgi:autotransporter-associated beta strand protein